MFLSLGVACLERFSLPPCVQLIENVYLRCILIHSRNGFLQIDDAARHGACRLNYLKGLGKAAPTSTHVLSTLAQLLTSPGQAPTQEVLQQTASFLRRCALTAAIRLVHQPSYQLVP